MGFYGPAPGHLLFVCGSASEWLRLQVVELAGQANVSVETLEPACMMPGSSSACRANAIQRAAARVAAEALVMNMAPPAPDLSPLVPVGHIGGFADAVGSVRETVRFAGLFLSGGDTAQAVLERLNTRAIRLECEVLSGLVWGSIIGGRMDGLAVVTKAGAFGLPDALFKLRAVLRADNGIESS
jgi:uncharacterized protein YgbK (DUF1537 family)